jgi:hypothetical protein
VNDALPTILGVLLVGIVASTALLPLLRGTPTQPAEAPNSSDPAQAERFQLYRQVLELEFDQQTGKLSREDFEALSADLLGRAGEILRSERAEDAVAEASPDGEIDAEVEREIAAARKAFAQARREQLEAEEVAS